jgi:hypothetical protein
MLETVAANALALSPPSASVIASARVLIWLFMFVPSKSL